MDIKGLEKDANMTIKAIMNEVEEAASESPEIAAHPYKLQERRQRIIKRIWALVRKKMEAV